MKLVFSPRSATTLGETVGVRGHLRSTTGGSFSIDGAFDPAATPMRTLRDESLDSSQAC